MATKNIVLFIKQHFELFKKRHVTLSNPKPLY
ncbi:MAG: hypothetical protein ACI9QN_002625, partial [Arcticibacterium sp.]